MVRALSLAPLAVTAACAVDLGIEGMRYRCENDSQCALGFSCDETRICSQARDGGTPDTGVEPCGFDEDFSSLDPADWQRNGNAFPFPGFVQLTPVEINRRGTLWHKRRILAARFTYEMVFNIFGGGENGADGMTLAWVEEDSSARGGSTSNLAAYNLNGYVVEIDTFPNPGLNDPSSEHLAFARTYGQLLPDVETYGFATNLPPLRGQSERVLRVEFDMGAAQIFLDGELVLTATAAGYQPFHATFGATAATGGRFDSHSVHRLTLTCR